MARFIEESIGYLKDTYLPRMARALEALDPADVWWRPHAAALSVGNILLHLQGNVNQWILSGLGGQPDRRDRAAEFAADCGDGGEVLFARLAATVSAACDLLPEVGDLHAPCNIQGFSTTPFRAIYHVVEHFGWHCGQAVWIAKARGGTDHSIAFYDDGKIDEQRNR